MMGRNLWGEVAREAFGIKKWPVESSPDILEHIQETFDRNGYSEASNVFFWGQGRAMGRELSFSTLQAIREENRQ